MLKPQGKVSWGMHGAALVLWLGLATAALLGGAGADYWRSILADALVLLLLGLSLQWMMALGGLVSFGHAAFFALGAYGAALCHQWWQLGLVQAMLCGVLAASLVACVFAAVVVRSSGVYAAMLSLALAQGLWAAATQWVPITGGDNGVIGLPWVAAENRLGFDLALLACAGACIALLAWGVKSREGLALQASRDAPLRAAASGLPVVWLRARAYVISAAVAGLAGAWMAAHKGAVFPTAAAVATSVDALLVILLGGVHQLWGAALGAGLLAWLGAELGRGFVYWKGVLGAVVMLLMVLAPSGLLSLKRGRS
jgi:branched-chain amino acid transport system permease protein